MILVSYLKCGFAKAHLRFVDAVYKLRLIVLFWYTILCMEVSVYYILLSLRYGARFIGLTYTERCKQTSPVGFAIVFFVINIGQFQIGVQQSVILSIRSLW